MAKKEVYERDAELRGDSNKYSFVISLVIFLLILLVILIFGYLVYLNLPGEAKGSEVVIENVELEIGNIGEVKQFNPNMKFNHKEISYLIDEKCSAHRKQRMIEGFNLLSEKIGYISFYEVSENPDIDVSCSEESSSVSNYDENFFIAGEGGAKEIIKTERYSIINKGIILLYGNFENSEECNWPNVELHELIHVMGFNHSADSNSLMYPTLEDCNQKIDDSIVNELKRIYSEDNLPDLYFENVTAVKRGRWLDFNLTIKNSGSINSESFNYSIIEDGKMIDSNRIESIDYGAGIFITIINFKLENRNSKEISFVIDKEGSIKEINDENNIAKATF